MDNLCTCGHIAAEHNALAVCMAPMSLGGGPHSTKGLCSCPDFTSPAPADDTAVAEAVGVLVGDDANGEGR